MFFYQIENNSIFLLKAKQTEDLPTSNSLHWEIPKKDHVTWSVLYKKAQSLADSYQAYLILSELNNNNVHL
jgi:hypothetical protein